MTASSDTTAVANLTLGSLGGPETFGGQTSLVACEQYPEFSSIHYFDTAEEALGETGPWRVDATCVPEQMSRMGFLLPTQHRLIAGRDHLFVNGNVTHEYHCALLVREGTDLADVTTVLGHTGSITQSRPWLEEHLPHATIHIVQTNSLDAGQQVLEGGGSIAAVGTVPLAERLGLVRAADDIDGGSVGHYWLLAPAPRFDPSPSWLVIAGTLDDGGGAARSLGAVQGIGYELRSLWSEPIRDRLFHSSFIATLVGSGELEQVQDIVAESDDVWLAGAFVSRDRRCV